MVWELFDISAHSTLQRNAMSHSDTTPPYRIGDMIDQVVV
jgi:hypothetical protein